jgi:hypothetical protein
LGTDSGAFRIFDPQREMGFHYAYNDTSGLFYGGQITTGWSQSSWIDGCLFNAGSDWGVRDGAECTCVMLSDQVDGQGFFAVVSAWPDINANTFLNQPGNKPIVLRSLQAPTVVERINDSDSHDIQLSVTVPPVLDNLYEDVRCPCAAVGFRLFHQLVDAGSVAQLDRRHAEADSAWEPAVDPDGTAGRVWSAGTSGSVALACPPGKDAYLAWTPVFDSGFEPRLYSNVERPVPIACPR